MDFHHFRKNSCCFFIFHPISVPFSPDTANILQIKNMSKEYQHAFPFFKVSRFFWPPCSWNFVLIRARSPRVFLAFWSCPQCHCYCFYTCIWCVILKLSLIYDIITKKGIISTLISLNEHFWVMWQKHFYL